MAALAGISFILHVDRNRSDHLGKILLLVFVGRDREKGECEITGHSSTLTIHTQIDTRRAETPCAIFLIRRYPQTHLAAAQTEVELLPVVVDVGAGGRPQVRAAGDVSDVERDVGLWALIG